MSQTAFRPRRSCLYMPGANARALEKAKGLDADGLIFDLEDAVAPDAKADARELVSRAVRGGGYGTREIVVRINAADTPWHGDDLAMVRDVRPDAVLLPKPVCAADIAAIDSADIPIWAMIEMPAAILNIAEIAAVEALEAFVIGTNDLAKEIRAQLLPGRETFVPALTMAVMAARAHGVALIDGVFNDFRDDDGFAAECEQGRALGFDGKSIIHPAQIETANRVFAPSPEDIEDARAIVAIFYRPENTGKGVVQLDGKMVELLHLEEARRTLAIAQAIGL